MAANYRTDKRISPKRSNATSISASQRASCVALFFRWKDPKANAMEVINIQNELRKAKGDISESVAVKQNIVVVKHDIIRCNITKSKASNSGQFTLNLKRGKEIHNDIISKKDINYLEVLNPGDWVMIYIKKSGKVDVGSTKENSGFKMLGIIENVRYIEIDDPETGKPRLEYVVSGRDFGKVFESQVFFNPILAGQNASTFLGVNFLKDSVDTVKGSNQEAKKTFTADYVVKRLVNFYLGANDALDQLSVTNQPWYIPQTLSQLFKVPANAKEAPSFCDLIDLSRIGKLKYDNGKITKISPTLGGSLFVGLPSSGSVWSILEYMMNSVVNEMYTELMPDSAGNLRPSLVHRQVPFSNKANHETNAFFQANRTGASEKDSVNPEDKTYFIDLPRFRINSSDIKEKNIGKSDFERINHLVVVPKTDLIHNIGNFYSSSVNTTSIRRHGLKTFSTQSMYVLGEGQVPHKHCERFLHLLVDWFFMGHELYNGTIIIDGKNEHIQIGQNLFIEDIGQLFHIESVNHTYSIGINGQTQFTSSLSVSRGQLVKGNIASFIGPVAGNTDPSTISTSTIEGTRS